MLSQKPLVFIVDDDVSVRESLELLILQEGWQPEAFGTADEFLKRPTPTVPCCLILDVSLPGISGLELQSRISKERLHMPIIFITGHGNIPMSVRAMKAGAVEFLTKPFTNDALVTAVTQSLEYSRKALAEQEIMRELQANYSSLSPRERDVMRLVVTGMLNKQVGAELGISEITVEGTSRPRHAENERELSRGPCSDRHEIGAAAAAYRLGLLLDS